MLLYACARLGAMLVPLNWRLAVAEQLFILTDAGAKVLVLEQAFAASSAAREPARRRAVVGLDFAPPRGATFDDLLARGDGDGRNPHTDLSLPAAHRLHLRHDGTAEGRGAARRRRCSGTAS